MNSNFLTIKLDALFPCSLYAHAEPDLAAIKSDLCKTAFVRENSQGLLDSSNGMWLTSTANAAVQFYLRACMMLIRDVYGALPSSGTS